MRYVDAAIPTGMAWSSPFVRWQGSLAEVSSLELAADVTTRALDERRIDPGEFDGLVCGWTVPQPDAVHGGPALARSLGTAGLNGPAVSQGSVTSVACLAVAAAEVSAGGEGDCRLVVTADRTSNGPTLHFPAPSAPGGAPVVTNWVLEGLTPDSMLEAAEKLAANAGICRGHLDELVELRAGQYARTRGDQRRYLVPARAGETVVDGDEGMRPAISHLIRAHPADGAAGAVVTTAERARKLARGEGIARILSTGSASDGPDSMHAAARAALRAADLRMVQVDAVTTFSPFALGDFCFAKRTGFPVESMNPRGCGLVYGHPPAPAALRSVAELMTELHLRGGGVGLFAGWSEGQAAALVLRADD